MSNLEGALRLLASELEQQETPWALVGGLAVSVHADPRFTRDIDVVVAVKDDAEAELLVQGLGGTFSVRQVVEQERTGRLATVRLQSLRSHPGVFFDLLFASSGVEAEIVETANSTEVVDGLVIPVATPASLVERGG